jgi:phosphosulfolactate synthase (CoM biosynthesis protein A)
MSLKRDVNHQPEIVAMTEPRIDTHERAFDFLRVNERPTKPRSRGVTEIRGPYYTPMGKYYLQDILETMGAYVDALKFAAGSFSLMPRKAVQELLELCHAHNVLVSTGGFIEHVLTQREDMAHRRGRKNHRRSGAGKADV